MSWRDTLRDPPDEWTVVLGWREGWRNPKTCERFVRDDGRGVAWLVAGREARGMFGHIDTGQPPTHWQPLPEPP